MSLQAHVTTLKKRHSDLEQQIIELERHPSADDAEITALKKQKLLLKDKIERTAATQ